MSGPGYALILIPIAGTVFLIAWLLLVFHAGRHLDGTAAARRPVRKKVFRPRRLTGAIRVQARRIQPVRPITRPGRPAAWPSHASAQAGNVIQAAAAFGPGHDAGVER
jgi:hypothetical protein